MPLGNIVWETNTELRLCIMLIQQAMPTPDYADLVQKFGNGVTKKALEQKISQIKKRDVSDPTGTPVKAKAQKRKVFDDAEHEMSPVKVKKTKRVTAGSKHLAPTAETEDEQVSKEDDGLEEMIREVFMEQMSEES